MRTANSAPQWKDAGMLELIGIVLLIPIAFIAFEIIIGFMFRGFQQSNSERTYRIFMGVFNLCLGCGTAPYIYRFRKSYPIMLYSFLVLFLFQALIAVLLNPQAPGGIIGNVLAEISWVYLPMLFSVFLFRYSEKTLDFAETRDIVEQLDKETNKKYSEGTCTKCGGVTVVSRERESPGGNKIEFFCDHCGRFVRGNPLPGTVIGLVLVIMSMLFLYGLNSDKQDSLMSAFNLLCLIVLLVGAKTFYSGMRWTLHAASKKQK